MMDTMTTGTVGMKAKARTVATVFNNNTGVMVTSGVHRYMGQHGGFKFTVESIENPTNSPITSATRIDIDLRELYERAAQFDFVEKLNNKMVSKFAKIPHMEVKDGMFTVLYENISLISSTRKSVKFLKEVSKLVRTIGTIANYLNKMITKKTERHRIMAEKRAEKAAVKKAAAEAIHGAAEVIATPTVATVV